MINEFGKQSLKQLMSLTLFCTAVLLAGCGGADDSETESTRVDTNDTEITSSSKLSNDASTESTGDGTVVARRSTDDSQTFADGSDAGALNLDDFATQTNDTSIGDTHSVSDSESTSINTTYTANIQWHAPSQRENGNTLNLYEIAGYEVQYREVGAPSFTVVRVPEDGTGTQSVSIEVSADSNYELLIASYDIDGLFSDYYETRIEDIASLAANGS
jgi:hypothetical protein